MLLAELEDFVTRHRACGRLTGEATEPEPSGYMVTVTCSCGVMFVRWGSPGQAALEVPLGLAQAL